MSRTRSIDQEAARAERMAIDARIGTRIRWRRNEMGLSQEQLGRALGVSYQQVQKYERGQHRVSASRLSNTAAALQVSVSYFLDDRQDDEQSGLDEQMMQGRETLELIRAYHSIGDASVRRRVIDLIRSVGGTPV